MHGLRVLHCIYDDPANPWLGGGGSERVYELYRRLTSKLDVTVLAGAYPGARDCVRDGVAYEFLGSGRNYPLSRLTYGRAATKRVKRADHDAVVFDFSVYTPLRVVEDRRIGYVVHMPIGPSARERWGRVVGGWVALRERRMLRRARAVSTTSQWMAGVLAPLIHPTGRIEIVRSGVSDEFFEVRREEEDYILFYGRFDWFQKGLDTLLEALDPLLGDRPGLRAVIAGRGKSGGRLRKEIGARSWEHRIELITDPTRERVLGLLAGALVLVHPSRFEGYPMVPAEAMAAGVPVVATDVGAVSEIVGVPAAGALVPPSDARAVAKAVGEILDDGATRRDLSARARARARDLTWDRVAADHLRFVRSLCPRPD